MPGGGTRLRSSSTLEQKLQSELNQAWAVELTVNYAEAASRWPAAAGRVRRTKLDAIKRVEELRPELNAELVVRAEVRRLVNRDIPVVDPSSSQCRINTRFVAELPRTRSREAVLIEPIDSVRSWHNAVSVAFLATGYNIRTQSKVLTESRV